MPNPRKPASKKEPRVVYKAILFPKYPDVQRWYNNLKEGSVIVAEKSVQRLGFVCTHFNTTPAKIAKMTPKQAADLIMDVIAKLGAEGKSREYRRDYDKVIKSWCRHNGIKIEQKIKIGDNATPTKTELEQVPTPDQFHSILNSSDPRQKVECTMVGLAGLRPEVLGDFLGRDGLKIMDLPEVEVLNGNHEIRFKNTPTMVSVRKTLNKSPHAYFSFLPDEGCRYLKEWLEYRMRRDEKLMPSSPIIRSLKYPKRFEHIRTANVGDSMRDAIRRAGFDYRPYILRSYFSTRLLMAEADGLTLRDFRTFWLGHVGDIEHTYTLNKGKLPADLLEKMREGFAKGADKYLSTVVTNKGNFVTVDLFTKTLLEAAGHTPEQLEQLGDLSKLSTEEFMALVKEGAKKSLGINNGNSQKVVPRSELEKWLGEGWEWRAHIDDKKSIIGLPNKG